MGVAIGVNGHGGAPDTDGGPTSGSVRRTLGVLLASWPLIPVIDVDVDVDVDVDKDPRRVWNLRDRSESRIGAG